MVVIVDGILVGCITALAIQIYPFVVPFQCSCILVGLFQYSITNLTSFMCSFSVKRVFFFNSGLELHALYV